MNRYTLYKGYLTSAIVLVLLTLFSIFNVDTSSGAFYLCIFSLMINLSFIAVLVVKMVIAYRKNDLTDRSLEFDRDARKDRKGIENK